MKKVNTSLLLNMVYITLFEIFILLFFLWSVLAWMTLVLVGIAIVSNLCATYIFWEK